MAHLWDVLMAVGAVVFVVFGVAALRYLRRP